MLRPVGEHVIIEPITVEKTEGGIILPEGSQEQRAYQRGKVISVGKGLPSLNGDRIPPEVEPGDTILYRFGEDVKDRGTTYKLVREKDIIAVVVKEESSAQ